MIKCLKLVIIFAMLTISCIACRPNQIGSTKSYNSSEIPKSPTWTLIHENIGPSKTVIRTKTETPFFTPVKATTTQTIEPTFTVTPMVDLDHSYLSSSLLAFFTSQGGPLVLNGEGEILNKRAGYDEWSVARWSLACICGLFTSKG